MADIVLIHGTWTGAWLWKPVRDILRTAGHNVFTPSFTGMGDRIHLADLDANLDVHINDIQKLIEYEMLDDVILAAHSYGGLVLTEIAARMPQRVSGAVHLNAALPEAGECMMDMQSPERRADVLGACDTECGGRFLPKRFLLKTGLEDAEQEAAILGRTSDHPVKSLLQPVSADRAKLAHVRRKVHVIGSRGHSGRFARDHEWAAAQTDWVATEFDTFHFPMLTLPRETADLIQAQATGAG